MILGLLTKGILREKSEVMVSTVIELPLNIGLNLSESNIKLEVDRESQIALEIDKELDLKLEVEPE
jgi:hypothetical protein